MKRKKERDVSDEDEDIVSDDEIEDDEEEDNSDGSVIFNYNKHKDKLFGDGNSDGSDFDEHILSDNDFEDIYDEEDDSDAEYYPSTITKRLSSLFTGISTGTDTLFLSQDPRDRVSALRVMISNSDAPFSIYLIDREKFMTAQFSPNEKFNDFFRKCLVEGDANILDFLQKCNKRYNLFDLYFGNAIFQDLDEDCYSDDEKYENDREEIEQQKIRIKDLYHENGKYFAKELFIAKTGDVFPQHSIGMGKLVSPRDASIEVVVCLCMVIAPKVHSTILHCCIEKGEEPNYHPKNKKLKR